MSPICGNIESSLGDPQLAALLRALRSQGLISASSDYQPKHEAILYDPPWRLLLLDALMGSNPTFGSVGFWEWSRGKARARSWIAKARIPFCVVLVPNRIIYDHYTR